MSKLTSADLKRITEIRQQISSNDKSKKKKDSDISPDQRKELQALKKKAMRVLDSTEKRINELERELKPLVKIISKLTAETNKGDKDTKKSASAQIKDNQKKLQTLQKELELRKKQQGAIIQSLNDKAASKPVNTFTPPRKKAVTAKNDKKETMSQNSSSNSSNKPSLLQLLNSKQYIIVILIAFLTIITLAGIYYFYYYTNNNSTDNPTEPDNTSITQVDDSIIKINTKGTINGNNVNMRIQPDVSTDVIRQLHNNYSVEVIAKTNSASQNGAVLVIQTQITMESGKKIKLDAGKGITITNENETSYTVSYPISDGKTISGTVDKNSVKIITGETWYQVKTPNGNTGWVFGKYIIVD